MEENNNFTLSEAINGPLLAAAIGTEMLVGLATNSFLLILTLCHLKSWKQPSNIFLTNMLLANMAIVLLVMPFPIITSAAGKWLLGNTVEQKEDTCLVVSSIFLYSNVVTVLSLVLLSFDRFFFIVKALLYKKYMTARKAIVIVILSWMLAAILCTPPLLGFGTFEFAYSFGTCGPGWEGQAGFAVYMVLFLVIFVACIVITSLWTLIYTRRHLQTRNHRKNLLSLHTQHHSAYFTKERKIIGLFGMLILVHLFCFFPVIALNLVGLFTIIPPIPYAIVFVLFLSLTSLTPVVQSYFRRDIRKIIFQCKKSQISLQSEATVSHS